MNKLSTYISSLIVSVLLVFAILATSAALVADININSKKAVRLAKQNDTAAKVHSELEKYYSQRFGSSGIPANVYMKGISKNYIKQCVNSSINNTFGSLDSGEEYKLTLEKNVDMEKNITEFFEDYVEKAGYEKDGQFDKKVSETIRSTYQTIRTHSDIYRAQALQDHKVFQRFSKVYRMRWAVTGAILVADLMILILLFLINRKKKVTMLYWMGISSIIAGVSGVIPCIVLLATRYYDSFSIKQPAVFTSYTSAMYKLTEAFTAVCIAVVLIGIVLCVVYTITYDKSKHQDVKPTDL